MKKNDELRIGVIGSGGRGALAGHAHKPGEGSRIVACCDIYDDRLAKNKETYGDDIFVTKDYREIIDCKDVDAIFVCSPDFLHEEHTLACLEAGKHVYLEKPMAITVEGCDKILQAAYDNKVRLYLGHNMRHMDFTKKIKEVVDSGAIGEVKAAWCRHFIAYGCDAYYKDWHAEIAKSTGLLLQKAAHDIDILHWICGGYSKRVVGQGGLVLYDQITDRRDPSDTSHANVSWTDNKWPPLSQKNLNPIVEVEDVSHMLMHLDNGVFCTYQQCHFTPDAWRNYTIIGTEGRVENFNDSPGECAVRVWNKRKSYNAFGDEQYFIAEAPGGHGGADPRIVQEFVDYVKTGCKISTSAVAARFSVAAGCMATKSIRTNSMPYDVTQLDPKIRAHFEADVVE